VTYLNLFNAIGTAHGYGDNVPVTGTFNLPDYRGRFIRGVDGAVSRDPNAATRTAANTGGNTGDNVGSVQANATAKNALAVTNNVVTSLGMNSNTTHTHTSTNLNLNGANVQTGSGAIGSVAGSGGVTLSSPNIDHTHNFTSNVTLGNGDNETRPLNAYVNYIIKI
jgi:hypothetical protein